MTEIAVVSSGDVIPKISKRGVSRFEKAGSPIQPRANDAKVIPS